MATICFDLKRVDGQHICIQHCQINKFEYNYHIPFQFINTTNNRKKHWWLEDKTYKYVWILIGTDYSGSERIFFACNDKIWTNQVKKQYDSNDPYFAHYSNIRIVKLPFEHKIKYYNDFFKEQRIKYNTNNLKDQYRIYCPVTLNNKYDLYKED